MSFGISNLPICSLKYAVDILKKRRVSFEIEYFVF